MNEPNEQLSVGMHGARPAHVKIRKFGSGGSFSVQGNMINSRSEEQEPITHQSPDYTYLHCT